MKNTKKYGFTLGEVLLTVLIVGVIAILVLPSMMKNINAKSRMSLLKSMVASIDNVSKQVITKDRTTEITNTDIYNHPDKFLERFDQATSGEPFAKKYLKYSGKEADVKIPSNAAEGQAKALLKNGVGIGVINELFNKESTAIILDINGEDKPNMVGVDYFILELVWKDGEGIFAGDLHGYVNGGGDESAAETDAGLRTSCHNGNGAACFRLVELSGYDPEYIN